MDLIWWKLPDFWVLNSTKCEGVDEYLLRVEAPLMPFDEALLHNLFSRFVWWHLFSKSPLFRQILRHVFRRILDSFRQVVDLEELIAVESISWILLWFIGLIDTKVDFHAIVVLIYQYIGSRNEIGTGF